MVKKKKKGSCKITEEKRLQIRRLYDAGNVTQAELAVKFRVTQPYICQILKRSRANPW